MQLNKSIQLLTIGNTIVDLEYTVPESTLVNLSLEKGSMHLIDQDKKTQLIDKLGKGYHQSNGGSLANSLYYATLLGCKGHHLGVLGNDDIAQFSISNYDQSGIGHSFGDTRVQGDSGCCIVLITPDGERTMLTYLGVSSNFSKNIDFEAIISTSANVFIEGYLLTDEACVKLLMGTIIPLAKRYGAKLLFSLSDFNLISFFNKQYKDIIDSGMDMIFCNRKEAEAISGKKDVQDMAKYFRQYSDETIMTDGKNGATVITKTDMLHCESEPVKPVDTTGAGDSFAGTYIVQRINQSSYQQACKMANTVARLVVSKMGARPDGIIKDIKLLKEAVL